MSRDQYIWEDDDPTDFARRLETQNWQVSLDFGMQSPVVTLNGNYVAWLESLCGRQFGKKR